MVEKSALTMKPNCETVRVLVASVATGGMHTHKTLVARSGSSGLSPYAGLADATPNGLLFCPAPNVLAEGRAIGVSSYIRSHELNYSGAAFAQPETRFTERSALSMKRLHSGILAWLSMMAHGGLGGPVRASARLAGGMLLKGSRAAMSSKTAGGEKSQTPLQEYGFLSCTDFGQRLVPYLNGRGLFCIQKPLSSIPDAGQTEKESR